MNILILGDKIHATKKDFEFTGMGDLFCADSNGARYERMGKLFLFEFGNFKGSRRLFKVLCKNLTKKMVRV
tara:strand:- start:1717 stop:1929 length:213 start_codon:yes stop_codon:yes gene_type:complete